MYKDLTQKHLYENTKIKASFVFFSPLSAQKLSQKLGKNLRKLVTFSSKYVQESKNLDKDFNLIPYFSDGYKMYQFSTGYANYSEGLHYILKTMHLIENYGFTTDNCSMRIHVQNPNIDSNYNIFKLIMSINENDLIKSWNRTGEEKIYYNTISYIYPRDPFNRKIDSTIFENFSGKNLIYPTSERFGINYQNIQKNKIIINYFGGKNYENNQKGLVSDLQSLIEKIDEATKPNYNEYQMSLIRNLIEKQNKVLSSIHTYDQLMENYPDIRLFIDLKGNGDYLRQQYPNLREQIFKLLAYGGVQKGLINYDTDTNRIQIKDANIRQGFFLENIDFYDSKIMGEMKNCEFINCNIFASTLKECKIMAANTIRKSKVMECQYGGNGNVIYSSYLENKDNLIHAEIHKSLIKGKTSYLSEIDKESIPIPYKNPAINN